MPVLHKRLAADYTQYRFIASNIYMWSADKNAIYYDHDNTTEQGAWSLLHELGHAELNHQNYRDDLELLMMEVAAWKEAKQLAQKYRIVIDDDHIQGCIDTYRDWLHRRSKCILCNTHSLQIDHTTYQCHNCVTRWNVPASRLCMTRRRRVIA